ncbi:MAG: domain containing protein [Chloroflexi bacterium]|nr:domain containing protein [Chloroflexota bacterium]
MDAPADITILALRITVVGLLYLFLFALVLLMQRELGAELRDRRSPSARARLVVVDAGTSGRHLGHTIPLEPVTRIGRADGNTIVLDDEFVSISHAMILLRNERWWVRDAGSTNGTLVNGGLIEGEMLLRAEDEIQVGGVRLRLTS